MDSVCSMEQCSTIRKDQITNKVIIISFSFLCVCFASFYCDATFVRIFAIHREVYLALSKDSPE